jgi:leader peptidase (prepilin peptidase)/N-methyltransferase
LSSIGYLIAFVFGAIAGSFLNVCIVRIPKHESLVSPPSHCPQCKNPIRFYNNVPLVSYLFLLGRCRACRRRISPRYFIVELITGLFAVALFREFGLGFTFAVSFVFVAALLVISFIDLAERIVPDVVSLPGIVAGLAVSIINWYFAFDSHSVIPSPVSSALGVLIGGGLLLSVAWAYQSLTGVEGMGGGDVKLLAMIGAFLGWPSVPIALFFASVSGSVIGLALMLKTRSDGKYAIPFAPFLCMGAVFHLFFGQTVISFYLATY